MPRSSSRYCKRFSCNLTVRQIGDKQLNMARQETEHFSPWLR